MKSHEVEIAIEEIRADLHNGKDSYKKIGALQKKIQKQGIDREYHRAHCQFVSDVLDGKKAEVAYIELTEKLGNL